MSNHIKALLMIPLVYLIVGAFITFVAFAPAWLLLGLCCVGGLYAISTLIYIVAKDIFDNR